MNILLHICCANCAIYPARILREAHHEVTGFFFNHNIHPYQEYRRRLDTVREYVAAADLPLVCIDEYGLEDFLSQVAQDPAGRCSYCYQSRLRRAAEYAISHGFDAFTSSLLYSRYQNHTLIRQCGEEFAKLYGIPFLYQDFRSGWQEGIRASKAMGLYRQQYCGCIYSEKDRYHPRSAN
ncbi:MAG: epoxyqueuosine reductase QueH [Desulfuromonadales bacterium]|nr:epoxyqueuosine reductase QueH [Desulfuromonadales bacterium]